MAQKILVCRWDRDILDVLSAEGAEVVLLFDAYEALHFHVDEAVLATLHGVFRIASFDDMDELGQVATELALQGWQPDSVISLSEFSQFGAAYLAQLLGCPQPTLSNALKTRDKRAMKQAVRAAGVTCTDFVSLRTTQIEDGIARTEQELGFPVVVKPAAGLGTLGAGWAHDAAQLRAALTDAAAGGTETFWMAERPVEGAEYHVDAIWVGGVCRSLGIMRYVRPRLAIQTPGVANGSVLLPRAECAQLYADVEQMHAVVNTALDISDGITHLEFFKRDDDPTIVFSEIATRFAGGGITQTYRALGEDLRTAWLRSVVDPGRPSPFAADAPSTYTGWINLAPRQAGRIVAEPTQDEIDALGDILFTIRQHGVGDEFGEPHPSAWCLFLVFQAESVDAFERRGAQIEAALGDSFRVESIDAS